MDFVKLGIQMVRKYQLTLILGETRNISIHKTP